MERWGIERRARSGSRECLQKITSSHAPTAPAIFFNIVVTRRGYCWIPLLLAELGNKTTITQTYQVQPRRKSWNKCSLLSVMATVFLDRKLIGFVHPGMTLSRYCDKLSKLSRAIQNRRPERLSKEATITFSSNPGPAETVGMFCNAPPTIWT